MQKRDKDTNYSSERDDTEKVTTFEELIRKFKSDWQVSMSKGLFQLLILAVIKRHEKDGISGIQIVREIDAYTDSSLKIALGTIYPLLSKFKRMNIIEMLESESSRSRQKIYKLKNDVEQFNDIFTYVSTQWNLISAYVDVLLPESIERKKEVQTVKSTVISQKFMAHLAILSVFFKKRKQMHGSEILRELDKNLAVEFKITAGTIYPLLHSLESRDLLKRIEAQDFKFPERQISFYLITEKGLNYVDEISDKWNMLSEQIKIIKDYKNGESERIKD